MRMRKMVYEVRFLSPAFLGNAEQSGQWRTPPFKAQLRQWWRVVYAADHGFRVDIEQMRREEGDLFGNAWLSHREGSRTVHDHRRSKLRIRLDRWDGGRETQATWGQQEVKADAKIKHPEVAFPVGPLLYLGYGPLNAVKAPGGGYATVLKANAAIQAGEAARLSLAVPEESAARIAFAVLLMDRYGTVGGRSRNGWGSISLEPMAGTVPVDTNPLEISRSWRRALSLHWPHSLGTDEKGLLLWETNPFDDWRSVMRELAIVKIGLRTQFVFRGGQAHFQPGPRHWLSYPITRHTVTDWGANKRLPNSLRFKVRSDTEGRLRGAIFHLPCLPPDDFRPDPKAIADTWAKVHELLDELTLPGASRTYWMVDHEDRRNALKRNLDRVSLRRGSE